MLRKNNVTKKKDPFFRNEAFQPVKEEVDKEDLEVLGDLPKGLSGIFVRNGPNQREHPGEKSLHWFDGDGMHQKMFQITGNSKLNFR